MLNQEDFELLHAIHATGSLSKAAARMGKAPSSLSYNARQLEERIDALLFDRRGYRIALTPAGELLMEQSQRLRDDALAVTRRVQQVAKGWEAELRIVTDELIDFNALIPLIKDFDGLKSGVRLRFMHEVLSGTWESLLDNRADIVIGATNEPPAIAGLKWHELVQLKWVFAVAPNHPLAEHKQPLSAELISQYRAAAVADSNRLGSRKSYGLLAQQEVISVPGMQAKIALQLEGLACGWLPLKRVAALIADKRLITLQTQQDREPNILYLGWKSQNKGKAQQWWVERLQHPRLVKRLV
jgi:DNA-binding transcriptional LysR family regulator